MLSRWRGSILGGMEQEARRREGLSIKSCYPTASLKPVNRIRRSYTPHQRQRNYHTMPLPTDEELLKTGSDLVAQMQAIFGLHPGFRPGMPDSYFALLSASHSPAAAAKLTGYLLPNSPRARRPPDRLLYAFPTGRSPLLSASLLRPQHPHPRPFLLLHRHSADPGYRSECQPAWPRYPFQPAVHARRSARAYRHNRTHDPFIPHAHRRRVPRVPPRCCS